jgi:syntaxin 1B/2/3
MREFFALVQKIKEDMRDISTRTTSIAALYEQALENTKAAKGKSAKNEIDSERDKIDKLLHRVKTNLKALEDSTEEFEGSSQASNTEVRLRRNMHGTLSTKFIEVLQTYNDVQTKYDAKFRERVARELKVVTNREPTPEEVDQVLQSPQTSAFVGDMQDPRAIESLAYIQNRHQDILKLQASIKELHQLFVDMAFLVAQQGELIDQVEFNVNQAASHVEGAVEQLASAVVYSKKSRKVFRIFAF